MSSEEPGADPRVPQDIQAGRDAFGAGRDLTYVHTQVIQPLPVAESGPVVVGEIPRASQAFQERPALLGALTGPAPDQGVAVVRVVTGLRGTGKSQLAAACARQRISQRWRVVAWLPAEDPGQLLAGFERLAARLGLAGDGQDSKTSALRVRNRLEEDGQQCLLVLDNAASADVVRPLLPAAGDAQVIVTSSHQALAALGTQVQVDVFTSDEAATYLALRTGSPDQPGALQVSDELGFLPLALSQAAAVIAGRHLDYATYLHRLADVQAADYLARTEDDPYPRGTAEAIILSLDSAAQHDPEGLGRQLLEIASVLSPAGTTRTALLAAARAQPGRRRFQPRHGQLVTGEMVDRALQSLTDASLLTWTESTSSVVAHRLVMRVVRERAASDKTLAATFARAVGGLQAMLPPREDTWQHPALMQEFVKQVIVLTGRAGRFPGVPASHAEKDLLTLRTRAGSYLLEVFDFSRAIPLLEQTLTGRQRLMGSGHPATWHSRNDLAVAYQAAGRLEDAIALHEQTLTHLQQSLGPRHAATLTSCNNLALAYQQAGRLQDAIAGHEQALTGLEPLLGPDHDTTLRCRSCLADAYRATGRLNDAIAQHQQALAGFQRVLGPDHPTTLNSVSCLALTYQQAGRLEDAIALHEQALASSQRVLGPDHPGTLRFGHNLGDAHTEAGHIDAAIAIHEQTLSSCLRILGPDHLDSLSSRGGLASAYQAAGRLDDAIAVYEQALTDRRRMLGPDHPDTLSSQSNLACAYDAAGRLQDATALHEQVLTDRRRVLGADHPDTLGSCNNVACAYLDAGRPEDAIGLLEQVLADRRRVLGPDHPDTLFSRSNLALAYQAAGRLQDAIALLEQTLAGRRRVLGPDHPGTLASGGNLAEAYLAAGQQDDSISLHEQTLTDCQRVLPVDDPLTRAIRDKLLLARRGERE